jgi:membrane protease YdiL (CAAX protease family)
LRVHSDPLPSPQHPTQAHEPTQSRECEAGPFSWRLFWLLALMMLLASLMYLPYAIQLQAAAKPEFGGSFSSARNNFIIQTVLQTALLYWPLALIGLGIARRMGFGLPYLHAIIEGRPVPPGWPRMLFAALVVGLAAGLFLLVATAFFSPLIAGELASLNAISTRQSLPNAWQGLLGAMSAAINEEILLRLFMLSGLAWGLQRFLRRGTARPSLRVFWLVNILAALIFGLLHLPHLAALGVPLSPMLLVYVLALNGIAGLAYGRLYWSLGLECAMLAHFVTDIVLHVMTIPLHNLTP